MSLRDRSRLLPLAAGPLLLLALAAPWTACRAEPQGGGDWESHDLAWLTLRLPKGWTIQSAAQATGCPLAFVRASGPAGAWVYLGLDMECGGEWNDGTWDVELGDGAGLRVTRSPPPLPCRQGIDMPDECGHADFLMAAKVTLPGDRDLSIEVGHKKGRAKGDLELLRSILETVRLRAERLPPRRE